MHPAPSIIIFTVMSGLGYGLAAMLGLGILDPTAIATQAAHLVALALIAGGLLASTLHLGNPQRAWRALSQWRTSWLSREGVAALLTFLPLLISAWMAVMLGSYSAIVGLLGTVGSIATIYCTSMIYRSLKSVDAWHTWLTSAGYLTMSAAGGLISASLFGFLAGSPGTKWPAALAIVATLAAWLVRYRARLRNREVRLSTPESATGLGSIGSVRLFEPPHMTSNYLTREMVFKIGRKHADKIFALSAAAGAGLVCLLLFGALITSLIGSATAAPTFAFAALIAHVAGALGDRWLFFAEARHAVANYYGS